MNFVPQRTFGSVREPKHFCLLSKSRGTQLVSDSSIGRLIYVIFDNKRKVDPASQVSPTKLGLCSDSARSGPTPDADSKNLHGFRSACTSQKEIETLKQQPCERWPLLTARPRRGLDFIIPSFAVQVRNRRGNTGCAEPVSMPRNASWTAESASPRNRLPLHRHASSTLGSSAYMPMAHNRSSGLASARSLLPLVFKK